MTNFNGPEYKTSQDHLRLNRQHDRIKTLMQDGIWRTLKEISILTGDPVASISAQLRHLRKERFGSFTIERRARNNRDTGLFEYRMQPPKDTYWEVPKKETCRFCKGRGYIESKQGKLF